MADLAALIVDHYERHARRWAEDRQGGGWNDRGRHERFAAALETGATVLDLGCGSGAPVALNLVEHGLHVTGVDSSPTMISLCRGRMPDQEWIVSDMKTLSLGRRFDGILAWDSFFHLDYDAQRRMFAVFAEHAASRALLMFNTGPDHGEAIGSYRGDQLYHASLAPAEYRSLLAQYGFAVLDHAPNDPSAGGRTVWLCRRED